MDFGAPARVYNNTSGQYEYGAYIFGSPLRFVNFNTMYNNIVEFMDGYYYCASQIAFTHLDLAIGLNNARNSVMADNNQISEHSSGFGWLVQQLDDYGVNSLGNVIRVAGAMDIEHDPNYYADPNPTISWVTTARAFSQKAFYNFGNADCSMNYPVGNETNYQPSICGPEGVSGLLWDQDDIHFVSSLNGWGYPMPEIYDSARFFL